MYLMREKWDGRGQAGLWRPEDNFLVKIRTRSRALWLRPLPWVTFKLPGDPLVSSSPMMVGMLGLQVFST